MGLVLCDLITECLNISKNFSPPLKYHKITSCWYMHFTDDRCLTIFPLFYTCVHFSLYVLLYCSWWQDTFQYLTHQEIYYSLFQVYICYYILFTLNSISYMELFQQNKFPVLLLLIKLLQIKTTSRKYGHISICVNACKGKSTLVKSIDRTHNINFSKLLAIK